jgi:hypothetical protein
MGAIGAESKDAIDEMQRKLGLSKCHSLDRRIVSVFAPTLRQ